MHRKLPRLRLFIWWAMLSAICLACSTDQDEELTITFVGDLLLDRGVRERIERKGVNSLFHPSIELAFLKSDMVVANLECPATDVKAPINKRYIFRAEPDWLLALKEHGITHLNMANNHAMDQGRKGLVDTQQNIINAEMVPTGFGMNHTEACAPQLIANSPRPVYLFSSLRVPSENWTFLENKPSVCEASIEHIVEQVRSLKSTQPNAISIIQLHWGAEHRSRPMLSQVQSARALIDVGADAIIGHHSHTIQTVEWYQGKPIFYGIGNFIFDQQDSINSEGLLVRFQIKSDEINYTSGRFVIEQCQPRLVN